MSRTQTSYTGHEFLWLVMMTSFPSLKIKKTCADYMDDPQGVKGSDKDFYGPYSAPGEGKPQYLVVRKKTRARCGAK